MPRLLPSVFVLSICLQAQPSVAAVHWLCGLSDELTRLVCVADADPLAAVADAAPTSAVVNGTRFPLDARQRHTVPMWSPPTEFEFVEHLARATLCYRTADCAVTLSAPALTPPLAAVRLARTP